MIDPIYQDKGSWAFVDSDGDVLHVIEHFSGKIEIAISLDGSCPDENEVFFVEFTPEELVPVIAKLKQLVEETPF